MVKVWIPALLRPLVNGQVKLAVEGSTVREALHNLSTTYPNLGARLWDGQHLRPGLAFAINGQIAPLGLSQTINTDDEVEILPAIGGGTLSPASHR
ncbi:MAG: MoaD/ThiS family protein [Chloroflexi bacterium]|nr:MoaD/ThiS family protein [Chloroflexota bacterium]MCL5946462.1 MoaD/ThiS family protein [Chloroflexota bacterium]